MDNQNYPARGKMSEDGKYYAHTDGSVHERITDMKPSNLLLCPKDCSMLPFSEPCPTDNDGNSLCRWQLVDRAYVLTDEEREACDMARKQIAKCRRQFRHGECYMCSEMLPKTCPARVYLANRHQSDAWEVNV